LSELLEILDHLVSETEPSNFVESGSVEQASALHINQKSEHPVWQTGTFGFSRT
jgi:hypothetical protein